MPPSSPLAGTLVLLQVKHVRHVRYQLGVRHPALPPSASSMEGLVCGLNRPMVNHQTSLFH